MQFEGQDYLPAIMPFAELDKYGTFQHFYSNFLWDEYFHNVSYPHVRFSLLKGLVR